MWRCALKFYVALSIFLSVIIMKDHSIDNGAFLWEHISKLKMGGENLKQRKSAKPWMDYPSIPVAALPIPPHFFCDPFGLPPPLPPPRPVLSLSSGTRPDAGLTKIFLTIEYSPSFICVGVMAGGKRNFGLWCDSGWNRFFSHGEDTWGCKGGSCEQSFRWGLSESGFYF